MSDRETIRYLGPECNLSQKPTASVAKKRRGMSSDRVPRYKIKYTFLLSSCAFVINNGVVRIVFQHGRLRLGTSFYYAESTRHTVFRALVLTGSEPSLTSLVCCSLELTRGDCQKMTNYVIKMHPVLMRPLLRHFFLYTRFEVGHVCENDFAIHKFYCFGRTEHVQRLEV